jgi:hypothetical protein
MDKKTKVKLSKEEKIKKQKELEKILNPNNINLLNV